ncbi:collagen alpha-1(I) chain-like [Symphalangus syndactylus]|uniref:collagen alpha-1(I) chain-like n=1 Tax=Symphalangus syndactylus TaxID=9590 RepID=UPI0030059467
MGRVSPLVALHSVSARLPWGPLPAGTRPGSPREPSGPGQCGGPAAGRRGTGTAAAKSAGPGGRGDFPFRVSRGHPRQRESTKGKTRTGTPGTGGAAACRHQRRGAGCPAPAPPRAAPSLSPDAPPAPRARVVGAGRPARLLRTRSPLGPRRRGRAPLLEEEEEGGGRRSCREEKASAAVAPALGEEAEPGRLRVSVRGARAGGRGRASPSASGSSTVRGTVRGAGFRLGAQGADPARVGPGRPPGAGLQRRVWVSARPCAVSASARAGAGERGRGPGPGPGAGTRKPGSRGRGAAAPKGPRPARPRAALLDPSASSAAARRPGPPPLLPAARRGEAGAPRGLGGGAGPARLCAPAGSPLGPPRARARGRDAARPQARGRAWGAALGHGDALAPPRGRAGAGGGAGRGCSAAEGAAGRPPTHPGVGTGRLWNLNRSWDRNRPEFSVSFRSWQLQFSS